MVYGCSPAAGRDRFWFHRLPAALGPKAYWATIVGTRIAGTPPIIGDSILRIIRGGEELSAVTLARFFGVHVWMLPAVLLTLMFIHLYLVIRLGISAIPKREE
jgi:quinol-cytochrome oxidoreductase complex cytochrome b subunit